MSLYLNKNTKFKCQGGNAVFFEVKNSDLKTKIKGEYAILENCSLSLVGPPRPGQCNLMPDPSTGAPSPCKAATIPGVGWDNSSNVKVSGLGLLNSSCSIKCPFLGATIAPFGPTYGQNTVDDNVSDISVNIGSSSESSIGNGSSTGASANIGNSGFSAGGAAVPTVAAAGIPEQENSNTESQKDYEYALCDYKNCDKAETCEYLKTSYGLKETNESINAAQLKNNIGKDEFDLYAMECGNIATTLFKYKKGEWNTYSVAHHHIIPANQCFKQYPEIVKLGNYYDYDINNAWNGICLPTMNSGYDGQSLDLKLDIAFEAMKKLGKQWHKGPHGYSNLTESINKEIDELFTDNKPIKDYKTSVDEYLEQFRGKLESESKCRAKKYEEEKESFCRAMNHVSEKIANKLRKFETDPKKSHSFFVSKIALYYAYNDILQNHKELFFGKEG